MGASVEQEGYLNGPNQPWGRAQGHYQGHMGSFNPITGQWAQEPAQPDRARYAPTPVCTQAVFMQSHSLYKRAYL